MSRRAAPLTRREMVLLRIRDEDGVEGLGEAVPLSLRGGVTLRGGGEELEELARALLVRRTYRSASANEGEAARPRRC